MGKNKARHEMTEPILIDQLATEVWQLFVSDTENAEARIEDFLKERFSRLPEGERLKALEKLVAEFEGVAPPQPEALSVDNELMNRIASLILGKQVLPSELSSDELGRRLAESLNTIFDSLNRLTGVINKTLMSGAEPGAYPDKTIRQVIGSHLEGGAPAQSLESHLGRISHAFLTVQQAFKETARSQVERILDEISPDRIVAETANNWKFGPFRKAQGYAVYVEKYERIRRWFESGRFMEEFLREFEKKCQQLEGK